MKKISGFVMPYNRPNFYNEVLKPHTFKNFAEERRLIPIYCKHHEEELLGIWTKLIDSYEGLYAEGSIMNEDFIRFIFDNHMENDLKFSICYQTSLEDAINNGRSRRRINTDTYLPVVYGPENKLTIPEISIVDSPSFDGTYGKMFKKARQGLLFWYIGKN